MALDQAKARLHRAIDAVVVHTPSSSKGSAAVRALWRVQSDLEALIDAVVAEPKKSPQLRAALNRVRWPL